VDYVVLSSVQDEQLNHIVITYDIGCQYSKKFLHRMNNFPANMRIHPDTLVEFAIPSWHINSHGPDCRANFGLSYRHGVGRTCGEEIETSWAQTNVLGTSTREMGPGARHETLNSQWGGSNFQKILGFRKLYYPFLICTSNIYNFRSTLPASAQGGLHDVQQAPVVVSTVFCNLPTRNNPVLAKNDHYLEK
jgi:hypothetical protein